MSYSLSTLAQSNTPKYLLFNNLRDSIILVDTVKYYKIDKNLFDISRYNEIDTIGVDKIKDIEITTVEKLWEGRRKSDQQYRENLKEGEPINVIDTYNVIFKNIYVLEKISNCSYKRTRVWWIDY
jgi:hypothetical protein